MIDACQSVRIPLAIVMAGGYARDVNDIVDIHASTVLLAANATQTMGAGLGRE